MNFLFTSITLLTTSVAKNLTQTLTQFNMFTAIKNCHKTPKHTVFGYIRRFTKKYCFCHIPLIIKHICLAFYLLTDQWNEDKMKIDMRIEGNCWYYRKEDTVQNAYLNNTINTGKYEWKFKLKKYDADAIKMMQIGIEGKSKIWIGKKKHFDYPTYAFNLDDKCLKEGDTITMTLDMNVLQLNLDNNMKTKITRLSYTASLRILSFKNVTIELLTSSQI